MSFVFTILKPDGSLGIFFFNRPPQEVKGIVEKNTTKGNVI
jgi:hypothetical protein